MNAAMAYFVKLTVQPILILAHWFLIFLAMLLVINYNP